LREV